MELVYSAPRYWSVDKLKSTGFGLQRSTSDSGVEARVGFFDFQIPEPLDHEVIVKIRSSSLNFNSIWSIEQFPVSPFSLIKNFVQQNPSYSHHIQDFAVIGSDGAGTIVQVGKKVVDWKIGDEVVIHCSFFDSNKLNTDDEVASSGQAIWGYETNFGSLSDYSLVHENQLMKKPQNLDLEKAGIFDLTLSTAYRMLMSKNAIQIQEGQSCLIWGAAGSLGVFAIQLCLLAKANPICVVSTQQKAEFVKSLGAKNVIVRDVFKDSLLNDNGSTRIEVLRWFKKEVAKYTDNLNIVFEHVGRETLNLSTYLLGKGGSVVICGATSGYETVIDLIYLWMNVKKIIGSHISSREDAIKALQLVSEKKIHVPISKEVNFEEIPLVLEEFMSGKLLGRVSIKHKL